jgi:hypothetical protein
MAVFSVLNYRKVSEVQSLLPGKQTGTVPAELLLYFNDEYLTLFIGMFPNAEILAADEKARDRLNRAKVDVVR